MWLYNDVELTEVPEGYVGFTYCITNLKTGRQYIGKKNFYSNRRVAVKGRKTKKKVKSVSDWRNYYGSNAVLMDDVSNGEVGNFRRDILRLCKSKAEMSYYEIKEQIEREVLFKPDLFYNNFIGCRIHAKHLKLPTS
jgi:hypothetical protein